ncbi:MAG: ribose-phosphate diphosphokinase [Hyphomonas sp.]
MSRPLLCLLPGAEHLGDALVRELGANIGEMEFHRFPDAETYIRFLSDPAHRHVALVACLNDPDAKLIPLLFAARAAHDLGAHSVGLIAPYMPYLRQDRAFHPGESVSARHIGAILSGSFSWVATVDPHLHRLSSLTDVFSIPNAVAHATGPIAQWIGSHVEAPMLFGPDAESEQWVRAIADACGAPYAVFHKERLGDESVHIDVPVAIDFGGHTPVIVDDVVSSGGTVLALVSALLKRGSPPPACCVVHGLFSDAVLDRLKAAGAGLVVTTNSVRGPAGAIDITPPLADAVRNASKGTGAFPG